MATAAFQGPLGPIVLTEAAGRITRLVFGGTAEPAETPLLIEACRQLRAYFNKDLEVFDLPLEIGSGPRADFLRALLAIPYGETRTYGELGRELGLPAQAVGQACGANPIALIIPCHRVLGANGLGGFSAPSGVETKVALLKHEGAAGLLI